WATSCSTTSLPRGTHLDVDEPPGVRAITPPHLDQRIGQAPAEADFSPLGWTGGRRASRMRTSWPRASKRSTVWEPIKPAPPVTRTFIYSSCSSPQHGDGGDHKL